CARIGNYVGWFAYW
nr:immunoglobulin heavy chain junction region [Mus musculus]